MARQEKQGRVTVWEVCATNRDGSPREVRDPKTGWIVCLMCGAECPPELVHDCNA